MALFRATLKKLASVLLALAADAPAPAASANANPSRPLGALRAANAATAMAGSIQLVGLTEIKQEWGAGWSAVADIACRIAEQTIQRHISDEDAYQRHGEETFVLCFASPDKAEAEATTRTIAEEIATLLARQTPQINLQVDRTVAEVAWADIDNGGAESIAELIARELSQVRAKAEAAARAWRDELVSAAAIRFGPILHAPRRIVTGYRAMLNEQTGSHALQRLASVTTPEELRGTLHELDCLIFGRAIKALDRLLRAGGMAHMLIPVNFNALSDGAAREAYLNLCRGVPQSYRRRLLFEVYGAAPGMPVARQIEIALALKPYGCGVLVELPAGGRQLPELASARLLGVSVDAKSLPGNVGEATTALTRLVSAASALNLQVFVHGADTLGVLKVAQKAPADYVDGRAVALPMDEPKVTYHWKPH